MIYSLATQYTLVNVLIMLMMTAWMRSRSKKIFYHKLFGDRERMKNWKYDFNHNFLPLIWVANCRLSQILAFNFGCKLPFHSKR